ncbi:MAG: FAD-dependent monooxygenase [Sphingobium sp.]
MPLIIGGGPAGAAAAIMLARSGMAPVIVERSCQPADVICGGFLSWNSVALLQRCGVDPLALGGYPIDRARLFSGRRMAELPLPAGSVGLSRGRLDAALLDGAVQAGAQLRRGVTVRALEDGVVRYADGTSETPDRLILATGKHDLRGAARTVASHDPAIGLRWRFRLEEGQAWALGSAIELHLFAGGYAGLVMQEEGMANLCLAVRRSAFLAAGRRPAALLRTLSNEAPVLADRLGGGEFDAERAQAIANIPYGWRAGGIAGNTYRVGDQIGVIPSLAGEGVAIALATGMAAADAVVAGYAPQAYQARCSGRLARPIRSAVMLWTLAERPLLARLALPVLNVAPGLGTALMRMTRVNAVRL